MESYFNKNGLIFWTEKEFKLREKFRDYFVDRIRDALIDINPSWRVMMVEAPLLMPREFVNTNYTNDDMFVFDDLVLRPETTPGTYQFIRHLFDDTNSGVRTPVCVWQAGKSFRREQDQPTKFVRLKEFYQLEFQCVYAADSANNYHQALLAPVADMICDMVCLPTRLVKSDRLPSYSLSTIDVEVANGDMGEMMEVCSMSLRKDFPGNIKFTNPKNGKVVEKELLVAEVAVGLDRCVYSFMKRTQIQDVLHAICESE